MKQPVILLCILMAMVLALNTDSVAAEPSENLLPVTTKGYVSVADVDLLRESFQKTQLGELIKDPLMKPFFEDLREQFEAKLGQTDVRLNITISDLEDVYGGEVCLAIVQPDNDENLFGTVLLVDITGHEKEADALLKKISDELTEKKATRQVEKIDDVELIHYTLPKKEGATKNPQAFYFIKDKQLVASDDEGTIKDLLSRFGESEDKCLADVVAYQKTMERCQEATGDAVPQVRWFVEPFGYVQTVRAAAGGRQRRGTDMLKVLKNQGFSAIQGVGGFVSFYIGSTDIIHRTFVYAPPTDTTGDRYKLAARMLMFPNDSALDPEDWVPANVSNYVSLHWKMKEAFEFSKSLVDELAGAPVFDDIWLSLKEDPSGPQIDIREGLVNHLDERVSFFTDYELPITPTSERWLLAFKITNPTVVSKTLDKAMEADPDATKRVIGKKVVWEITRNNEEPEFEELDIGGIEFGELEEEEEEEEGAPLLEHAAMTVTNGCLIVASHVDFLEPILEATGKEPKLTAAADFVRVDAVLKALGADKDSLRFFARTDKTYHSTYEMIRQDKMPESKSLMGGLLNRMLGPEERDVLREQQIKGDKMPEFEKIQKYFGPAGAFNRSVEDGWLIAGCLLPKEPRAAKAADPPAAEEDEVKPAVEPAVEETPVAKEKEVEAEATDAPKADS